MVIRKAAAADIQAVLELTKQLHKVHMEARPELFNTDNSCITEKRIKETIKGKNNIVFVAEQDGEIVGFCCASLNKKYYNNNERSAFVDDLYVIPEQRHKGIATALFSELKSYVTEWGAVSLDLCVWDFNAAAKSFYEKVGMKTQRTILEMKL